MKYYFSLYLIALKETRFFKLGSCCPYVLSDKLSKLSQEENYHHKHLVLKRSTQDLIIKCFLRISRKQKVAN